MPKPIVAYGWRGMNNLIKIPAKLLDEERRITPNIILNAEPRDAGAIVRRQGYSKKIALPGSHSLSNGLSVLLVAAQGVLYQIESADSIVPICTIPGQELPLCYSELNNKVYIGNMAWTAVLNLSSMTVRSWGLPLPSAPEVTPVAGDLPPGTYSICYTVTDGEQLSGNGPLTQVSWQGSSQGLVLDNLPAGGQCWITHPNGTDLFLANQMGNRIAGQAPTLVPLPSFTCTPPPGMSQFGHAFGRVWGVSGRNLVYSEPFHYDWFKPSTYKTFLEELHMIAFVNDGIFVASNKSTWFLDGTDPARMIVKRLGEGAIPGTLTYAQMPAAFAGGAATSNSFANMSLIPTPVWMSPTGFVVGTHDKHLTYITQRRLKIVPRSEGASLYRVKDGVPQIITVLRGPSLETSLAEESVFRDGKLFD